MDFITRTIMSAVIDDERARLNRIKEANDAYAGKYKDLLIVRQGQADDNTKPNLARLIVDKGKTFLMGAAGPKIKVDGNEPAQAWLDACLKANRWPTKCKEIAQNGGIAGHAFIKLSGARTERGETYPRIIVQDPANVTAHWDADDISDVLRYRIQYPAVGRDGKPMVKKQVIERDEAGAGWTVIDSEARNGGAFIETSRVAWPWPWAPMLDCQNLVAPNVYYGMADLETDVLHLIRRIQFVLSNAARLNRIHAHPKTWGRGFKTSQLEIGADEMLVLPGETAQIGALEATGDMAGSMALYNALNDLLFMLARIPPITMSKLDNIGAIAGIALKILYGPIVELTNDKRGTYGDMIEQMAVRLLEMGNYAGATVTLEWPEIVPANEVEAQQVLLADKEAGLVSSETASAKRGYDWAKEKGLIDAQKEENMQRFDTPQGNTDAADDILTRLTRR
jgi:hypothetical protein